MTGEGGSRQPVLVISDDEDLGGLIALNLRRRRLLVEQTDFCLATTARWSPANGRPVAVVIDIEKPSTDGLSFLRVARRQSWLSGVPIILAADNAAALIAKLGAGGDMLPTRLDDVGAIVTAVLFLVAASSLDVGSPASALRQNETCEVGCETKEDEMAKVNLFPSEIFEIDDVPLNRRAANLERVFRDQSPGEVFWVAGHGDVHHYERFLHARFPGEVEWVDDFDINGRWIARVARKC